MKIAEFLSPQSVLFPLQARGKPQVLRELSDCLVQALVDGKVAKVVDVLEQREKLGSTGIGEGVAIPHGKLPGLQQLVACFGVAPAGVDFEAIDGKPTRMFFALLAPENSAGIHLKALARISRLFKNPRFREAILAASTPAELYQLILSEDAKS